MFSSNLRVTVPGLEHCLSCTLSHAVFRETNKYQWTMGQELILATVNKEEAFVALSRVLCVCSAISVCPYQGLYPDMVAMALMNA